MAEHASYIYMQVLCRILYLLVNNASETTGEINGVSRGLNVSVLIAMRTLVDS